MRARGATVRSLVAMAVVLGAAVARAETPPVAEAALVDAAGRDVSGLPVRAVRFLSPDPLDPIALRALVRLRQGEPLTADKLRAARQRLAWREMWSSIVVETPLQDDGVAVIFHLVARQIVGAVHFEGNARVRTLDLERRARLAVGTPLEEERLAAAVERLRDLYGRKGFDEVAIAVSTAVLYQREVEVVFTVQEGTPVTIGEVAIEGNGTVSVEDVEGAVKLHPGDVHDREVEHAGLNRVRALYRERNFYGVTVGSDWVPIPGSRFGTLRVHISSGPPYELVFSGNEVLSRKKILGLIDLGRRPVVSDGTWRELARRIARAYRERGYYYIHVAIETGGDSPRRVEFRIAEGKRYVLERIAFTGVTVPADTLLEEMHTRPRGWWPFGGRGALLDDVLDDDLRKLWFLYRRLGYESAEIVDSRLDVDQEAGRMVLTIAVDEGPRTVVQAVDFDGVDPAAARAPRRTRVGAPYSGEDIDADRTILAAVVARSGHPDAAVVADVERVRAGGVVEATVHFRATPGPLRHIGPVILQGNRLTRDRVIMRELPFREGDLYDPEALQRGQNNLYSLRLFRRVTVAPLEVPPADERPIGVRLDERAPGSLQYGFGYSTNLGFRAFTEASYDNLQGMGRRISLRGEVNLNPSHLTPSEYLGDLGFRDRRALGTRWTFRNDIILQRTTRDIDPFSLERFAVIPALEREVLPGLTVGMELQFDQARIFDVASDAILLPEDEGFSRTTSIGPFLVADRRDDAFSPRAGTFESLRLRYATPLLASDTHALKLVAQHTQYLPLVDDLIVVYALRGGWARSLRDEFTVPIRDRFFLGGRTTVRGFDENSIGPVGSAGTPTGGDLVLNANAELRFPLWFGFSGAAFADGGGVYLQERAISIHDFRRSTGVGLRYVTPVGPISLEYGFKLDRRDGESLGALHFSIGNIF